MKFSCNISLLSLLAVVKLATVGAFVPNGQPKVVIDKTDFAQKIDGRTYVSADIKTPDPVPIEGQQAALDLMKTGRLYRYNISPGEQSVVSLCEKDVCDYTGFKYCVGLNSCGSALMLLLKTSGLKPGQKVLSNAFTFGAVPSAIEHAEGKAVYVESNRDHVIDVTDLEKKLKEHPDCNHVLISHMRGKVADMDAIKDLCAKHDAILLEDCAHSLGVFYKGEHSGHKVSFDWCFCQKCGMELAPNERVVINLSISPVFISISFFTHTHTHTQTQQ
jgi:aspartate/methionine/tyrosine aminotransferase